jgi:hypothetical protein
MASFVPAEKAQVIRYPSTANLMIDSKDRATPTTTSCWDFQITRTNSILNGYFTRIGTTEVILEWFYGNASVIGTIDVFNDDTSTTETIDLNPTPSDPVFYTYEQALNAFVELCNVAFGYSSWSPGTAPPATGFYVVTNLPVTTSPSTVGVALNVANVPTDISFSGPGIVQMGFVDATQLSIQPIYNPDLRAVRYLDFVSSQLTYNQSLKDSSTDNVARDVLCRWYFAWDVQPVLDGYGFPILMGYTSFTARRIFNPPKQIRWDPQQPLGNLGFQVYDDQDRLFSTVDDPGVLNKNNWLMTLQVSEV